MSEPIRVLHFADTHIGMENYGKTDPKTGLSSRVVDFLRRLDDMVKYAGDNDVDLVIFAGDAFKTRNPNPTYQREFAWRIQDLAQLAPVVMLIGNHDIPPTVLKASSIEIYSTLSVPNVWVADDYTVQKISTRRGDVIVGAAPYPMRARLMQDASLQSTSIADADAQLQRVVIETLEHLADQADTLAEEGDDDLPRILTGHFTVAGAVWGSERSVMLGRDVQVPLSSLADPRWDYVALGHIHKRQCLTAERSGVPPVVYSGSLERIDFGEANDTKGFCWVELARSNTNWWYEDVAARPMVTVRGDCRTASDPTRTMLDEIQALALRGAVVRLVIGLTPETEALLNENALRDALRQAGVFHIAGIRKDVERTTRARLGGSPEGLSHEELLERYFISREIPTDRRQELMTAAADIMGTETGDE